MNSDIRIFSAESEEGRRAILEVMGRSYTADIDCVKPGWALARVVDGVPVSFITIDPENVMDLPYGSVRYGFVPDAATRDDRRREGHFRGMMESAWERLSEAGRPLMLLHGEFYLYSRLGFAPYTTNLGIFADPLKIQRILGSTESGQQIETWQHPQMQQDLLVVPDVCADSYDDAKAILKAAASLAVKTGKARVLFQPASGSGCPSTETPFFTMARACGASIVMQGSDPQGRRVEHTEWVKVIDPAMFLRQALAGFHGPLPAALVSIDTEMGAVTLEGSADGARIVEGIEQGSETINWPAYALAQLVLGYLPAGAICAIHNTSLSPAATSMLEALFPQRWTFSTDESWLY